MSRLAISTRGSPVHGRGVFADQAIPAGAVIIEYLGERVSRVEAERREAASASTGVTYLLYYDDETCIDGAVGGNEARYINHGCTPNCAVRRENGRAFIDAARAIDAGEELLIDYAFDSNDEKVPCRCAAPGCRGFLNEAPFP